MPLHPEELVAYSDGKIFSKNDFEYLLEAHCCFSGLEALVPGELACLEACCVTTRQVLRSDLASGVWIASADAAAYRSRLILPSKMLASIRLHELKPVLGSLRMACGGLHSSCPLNNTAEVYAVSNACAPALSRNGTISSCPLRVIVGRLHFDLEDILSVLANDANEELLCFSNKIAFWWPSNGSRDRDTKLDAAIGCREGRNILEVCCTNMYLQALTLKIDLHIVIPGSSGALTSGGIEVNVNENFAPFSLPGFDISDDSIRKALVSPEGVLCILTVSGPLSAAPSANACQMLSRAPQVKSNALNALALSPLHLVSA